MTMFHYRHNFLPNFSFLLIFLSITFSSSVLASHIVSCAEMDYPKSPEGDNISYPEMKSLDVAILDACGSFGSPVFRKSIVDVLHRTDVQKDMERLQSIFKDNNYFKDSATLDDFIVRLADLLSMRDKGRTSTPFSHVFCGKVKRKSLGGGHYANRFFEMVKAGNLGQLKGSKSSFSVIGDDNKQGVFVAPIVYKSGAKCRLKATNSLSIGITGFDFLAHITLLATVATNDDTDSDTKTCVASILSFDNPNISWKYTAVAQNNILISVYPLSNEEFNYRLKNGSTNCQLGKLYQEKLDRKAS